MNDDREDSHTDELLNIEGPNEPEAIGKSGGPRPHVSQLEASRRRRWMAKMLKEWHSADEMYEVMRREFDMDPAAVDRLEYSILEEWSSEDSRRKPYYKAAARRRILELIATSKDKGSMGAAMKGEELLSRIEGTQAPVAVDVHTTGEVQHNHAFRALLGDMDPKQLDALIDSERQLVAAEEARGDDDALNVTPVRPAPPDGESPADE